MSRRRRQSPPPPVVWPDLSLPGGIVEPEPSVAVSKLGFVEFHRVANRILDVVDPKFGTGALYTDEEIARNCRAREILKEELDRIVGQRDSVTFQTIESANRTARNVLRFDAKRTRRDNFQARIRPDYQPAS